LYPVTRFQSVQTIPCACMASRIFRKPAILAPAT
jgi:hypothetical protein